MIISALTGGPLLPAQKSRDRHRLPDPRQKPGRLLNASTSVRIGASTGKTPSGSEPPDSEVRILMRSGVSDFGIERILEPTRSLDSSSLKVFLKVRLPWATPHIFSGLKVAITLAVIGAIVAEFIGADTGLGYLILTNSGALKTSVVFFVLLILSILGIALFYAVEAVERAVCPWYMGDTTKAETLEAKLSNS